MNTLITGATGGFGRVFSDWFSQHHNGDRLFLTGCVQTDRENYIRCDLENPEEISQLIRFTRPDRVFHIAATYSEDEEKSFAVNALSAKRIMDSLRVEGVAARVVLFGSAAEYGVVSIDENPIHEDRILRPVSLYGMTKALQSQIAYAYAVRYGMDVVVVRIFNLLAPDLSERLFVGRVEALIKKFNSGLVDSIELGNLNNQRDYVDAKEASELINLVAVHGEAGEVYNIGSGRPLRMREILSEILNKSGLDFSIVKEGVVEGGRHGYDVPSIFADMNKTRSLRN